MAYGHKTPHQARQRATIVLLAARGRSNARIAAETHLHVDTVRRWRGRFAAGRVPALADRKRSGRPPTFTALQIAEVKALACPEPRSRAGQAPNSRARPSPGLSRTRSPPPLCAAGYRLASGFGASLSGT
ncbi:helix-turn-helix domain-containing protein [Streptomyces sp. NPDC056580]|uniref:helix-turn-helix domain-containing protein n=1 Tax=Streptomyces sp. NPDC056580 TaxID=3345872 RepID=UPI0036B7D14A